MSQLKLTMNDRIFLLVQFFLGIGYITFGFYLIFAFSLIWGYVLIGLQIFVGINILLFSYRFFTERRLSDFVSVLGAVAFLLVMLFYDGALLPLISLFFGFWALFNAFVHSLDIYIMLLIGKSFPVLRLIPTLFEFILGFVLIITYRSPTSIVMIQIAIYIILMGTTNIVSSIRVLFRHKSMLHLPAPVFISLLMPSFEVRRLERIKKNNPDIITDKVITTKDKQVSLYIYSKDDIIDSMGHMAIGYKGKMYNYGNYDPYNRKLGLLVGEGIMMVGKEEEIIAFDIHRGMTIFQFICEIDDMQEEYLEKQFAKLFEMTVDYHYPVEKDPQAQHFLTWMINFGVHNNYYKFSSGPFKTYNALTTNCVLITDYIFESTGMKFFQISGFVTPGAYYDYLNGVLGKPGSIVKEKHIYQSNKKGD